MNLSGRQLARQDLAAVVRKVLAEARFDPHLIELEVTALLTGQELSGGPRATDLIVTGALGELLDDRSA